MAWEGNESDEFFCEFADLHDGEAIVARWYNPAFAAFNNVCDEHKYAAEIYDIVHSDALKYVKAGQLRSLGLSTQQIADEMKTFPQSVYVLLRRFNRGRWK